MRILGGENEVLREGGRVIAAGGGVGGADAEAVVIELLSRIQQHAEIASGVRPKPRREPEPTKGHWASVVVQMESGEKRSTTDLRRVTPIPTVAVPYHRLSDAEQLLETLSEYLLHNANESKAQIANDRVGSLTAMVQRRAWRVLSGLLERETLAALFVDKGYSAKLAAYALRAMPKVSDGATPTLTDLQARMRELDVFQNGTPLAPAK